MKIKQNKSTRPAWCPICGEQLFYAADDRWTPEYKMHIYGDRFIKDSGRTLTAGSRFLVQIFVHKKCFREFKRKVREAGYVRKIKRD